MENNKKYRFAPKVYGRGVVPISREGRLIIFVIIAVIVGGSRLILGTQEDPTVMRITLFFVFVTLMAIIPILILRPRMKGTLKWRWGVKDVDRE